MDDKKIRKLNKKELLEILLSQARRIEELELELKTCNERLKSKEIKIDEVGSIAEACLKLNGIFEVAQVTVDQYMANVYDKCKKLESDTKEECQRMKEEALVDIIQEKEKVKKLSEKKKSKSSKSSGNEESKRIKCKTKMTKKRKVHS